MYDIQSRVQCISVFWIILKSKQGLRNSSFLCLWHIFRIKDRHFLKNSPFSLDKYASICILLKRFGEDSTISRKTEATAFLQLTLSENCRTKESSSTNNLLALICYSYTGICSIFSKPSTYIPDILWENQHFYLKKYNCS